jgi:[CysO sulfur-carrier protein]-S-L-cysteine hydrolase
VLRLEDDVYDAVVSAALDGYPLEICGLLGGRLGEAAEAGVYYPCRNAAASAKVYTLDPRDHLRADRAAEDAGLDLVGVVHSHTHTDAYPSPTDVDAAPDPGWHYVIVSLREAEPSVRSYRIVDGTIAEEGVVIGRR